MSRRTFGWVQNPGDLRKLRYLIDCLNKGSDAHIDLLNKKLPLLKEYGLITDDDFISIKDGLYMNNIPYKLLKGRGKGSTGRKEAKCSGIVQAVLDAQKNISVINRNGEKLSIKKPFTDDWTSDGYLRWAVSLGFLDYDSENDACSVSVLGKQLSKTEKNSEAEDQLLGKALLTYPPVIRVLHLIAQNNSIPITKFEIGSQLGFKGEMGFTSIPQEQYVAMLSEAENDKQRKEIKSNTEGDSDKYARMIAGWLCQLNWVEKTEKEIEVDFLGKRYKEIISPSYRITLSGLNALKKANGYSKFPRLPRIVLFQMLASKAASSDFLRKRRAYILESLKSGAKSIEYILNYLRNNNIETNGNTIIDDIKGLNNIGLSINFDNNKYKLNDTIIGLNIPKEHIEADEIIKLKETIASKLKYIDHKFLILVDYAFSDKKGKKEKNADARQFEIETADLFTKELNFKGERLGDSNRPDVIIYHNENGTIIDNKSYKEGFSVDKKCADEMHRYIVQNKNRNPKVPPNEWWRRFDASVKDFSFLFITSKLVGDFKRNLNELSLNTGIKGSAIGVESLLYLADKIKNKELLYEDFFNLMNNNEIVITY